jgi:hypothetical protein
MVRYFSLTLDVMDWITIEAILKASLRSLIWCRRASNQNQYRPPKHPRSHLDGPAAAPASPGRNLDLRSKTGFRARIAED